MHSFFKRKILIFVLTAILIIGLEMIMYNEIFGKIFCQNFFVELGLVLILLSIGFIPKHNAITVSYYAIIILFVIIMFMLNLTLDYCSGDIFSWKYITVASESVEIFDWGYIKPLYLAYSIGAIIIYAIGTTIICKLIKEKEKIKYRYMPKGVIIFLSFSFVGLIFCWIGVKEVERQSSNSVIYEDMNGFSVMEYTSLNMKKSALERYGLFGYNASELSGLNKNDLNSQIVLRTEMLPVTDNFFKLLEGMNVIEIMIETGTAYSVNEYLTPNLYELTHNGLYFSNNYSKNKTNISEYIGITGSACADVYYRMDNVFFSIPNMLKEKGYTTSYFHNNYGTFYNRENAIPNAGFDNVYFSLDINEERQWNNNYDGNYPLDCDTMTDIIDLLAPKSYDKPYYNFWTTLSTHGPYTGNNKNKKLFEEMGFYDKLHEAEDLGLWTNICLDDGTEIENQIETYVCETMALDLALGMLIDRLKENGDFDNTLIVLYGDHDVYYKTKIAYPLKYYMYNVYEVYYPEQYQTILSFYNPKLTEAYKDFYDATECEISDFTSPYVIAPTMLELLGVNYNPNLYVGKSIFQTQSPLDNLFYSHELQAIFSDKIYTSNPADGYNYNSSSSAEYEELFNSKASELLKLINKFNLMYQSNSFSNEFA